MIARSDLDPDRPQARPRPRRSLYLVFAVLVLVLGACSFRYTEPDAYGETARDGFIEGCEQGIKDPEQGTPKPSSAVADSARRICTCAYDRISDEENGIPFAQFEKLDDELGTGDGNRSKSLEDQSLGQAAARVDQSIVRCTERFAG